MQGGGGEVVLPVLRAPDNEADAVSPEQIQKNKFLKRSIQAITASMRHKNNFLCAHCKYFRIMSNHIRGIVVQGTQYALRFSIIRITAELINQPGKFPYPYFGTAPMHSHPLRYAK